jgi:hypothetical protein
MVCSGPVVLLEVQMHPDPGIQHPQVVHLEVVVITPHLQVLLNEVHWISLEALSQKPDLDPPAQLAHLAREA